ncbi:MAG: four-carbon acid sugar kinase family protein [Bacteroidota bacterium]
MKQQKNSVQNATELLASLPKLRANEDWKASIREARKQRIDTIIVLDDDPTGTQTVYDIPVLTDWAAKVISEELKASTPIFYILTNSRSLPQNQADDLALTIGKNIQAANQAFDRKIMVISRGDSTLRGHYPSEVKALKVGLSMENAVDVLIPAFFEGGRYTIHDIHYVRQNEQMIPAAQTPYAKDGAFGYAHSNLKDWVEEKTGGKVKAESAVSFSIEELRTKEVDDLVQKLNGSSSAKCLIINAADYIDLEVFALILLQTTTPFVCRTAASFVAALAALPEKELLQKADLIRDNSKNGGLIVVGSHVPKTTRQLEHLRQAVDIKELVVDVKELIERFDQRDELIARYRQSVDALIVSGKDAVLATSREVLKVDEAEDNLSIGAKISAVMSGIVKQLTHRPKYILAKGGITSSDTATVSLGVKRAMIMGQVLPGIPVWRLGEESKFPGLSYIIFPGNVGADDAIVRVVKKLA